MRSATIRLAACLALAALLAACNLVYSERPLFTADDAKGAAPLRTGVWLELDPKCQFDRTQPVTRWPKCAEWILVRPRQILGLETKPRAWTAYDYVLAAGEPRVLQVAVPKSDDADGQLPFVYLGLEARRLDPQGRIIEYRQWTAQCGAPPPQDAKSSRGLTQSPLPGLKPAPDAGHPDDCLAASADAVRGAVSASTAWSNAETWQWVRGAER
jgi:hypothetical protein